MKEKILDALTIVLGTVALLGIMRIDRENAYNRGFEDGVKSLSREN